MAMEKSKVLRLAKGYYGRTKNCIRLARMRVEKGLLHAYEGRKLKRRQFRSLWITRLNAACRISSLSYSKFISHCHLSNISLNRKMFAELAVNEPLTLMGTIHHVKSTWKIPDLPDNSNGHIASVVTHVANPKLLQKEYQQIQFEQINKNNYQNNPIGEERERPTRRANFNMTLNGNETDSNSPSPLNIFGNPQDPKLTWRQQQAKANLEFHNSKQKQNENQKTKSEKERETQ